MKSLLTILCVIITLSVSAQTDGLFANINLNGTFSNGFGNTTVAFRQGTSSKYYIGYTLTQQAESHAFLHLANSTNSKGIHMSTAKIWSDLPWALGGAKVATGYQLSITGKMICTEAWVQPTASWPDYVFSKGYDLPSLASIEKYIQANSHLPEVPSAAEVDAKGVDLGGMNAILLKKMEEMTLYMIKANKDVIQMQEEIAQLKLANAQLQQQLGK